MNNENIESAFVATSYEIIAKRTAQNIAAVPRKLSSTLQNGGVNA